jgi:hypothetical protein
LAIRRIAFVEKNNGRKSFSRDKGLQYKNKMA